MGNPVDARNRSWPSGLPAASEEQRAAVRVSCQTIALPTGSPVARSHTTVVSRWLVIPTAARSPAVSPPEPSAPRIT